jgi:hypothetical protein
VCRHMLCVGRSGVASCTNGSIVDVDGYHKKIECRVGWEPYGTRGYADYTYCTVDSYKDSRPLIWLSQVYHMAGMVTLL